MRRLIFLQQILWIMGNLHKFFLFTLYIMGITAVHHCYGAIIYPQKFRIYTALLAVPVAFAEYVLYRQYDRTKGKLWFFLLLFFAGIIPLLAIGLYEGGYNHVLKNILYFSGVNRDALLKLFPPPAYEMPDDFIFELTGILQFVFVIPAVYYLIRYFMVLKQIKKINPRLRSGR